MKKNIKNMTFLLIIMTFLNGCSFFNIGEPQGSCEELGCDYSDAGVCGDVFQIYETRYKDLDKSYINIKCADCIKGAKK